MAKREKIKTTCPCCGHQKSFVEDLARSLYVCVKCDAIHGRPYLGDSYTIVKPAFSKEPNVPQERWRYYDFTCLSSKGLIRRHGWYDRLTGYILQVG